MMPRDPKPKKTEYRTVSLPRRLAEDIQEIIDEFGYWPSMGAFVREGALEKMRRERQLPGKVIPEPILAFEPKEKRK